jgi:membrane-associated phospholipid phosphatase
MVSFILRCRLENVMAAGFSTGLAVFFLSERAHHSFPLNIHDIAFIMLPAGILAVKCLLGILFSPDQDTEGDLRHFLTNFFRPLFEIFRDWFPFLVLSACYFALYTNLIIRVNPHTADALLARADALLLGGHQPSFLMEPMINSWLTDFFSLIYFSYVLSLPAVALYFYLKKEKTIFRRIMMGYLMLMLMGIVSYLIFPAAGPGSFFASQYSRDLQGHAISHGVSFIIQSGRVAYDCFPSLHVGISLLVCVYLRDYKRKLFLPALGYVALMCLATLYLRYHYLIDLVGSFMFVPAAYWLNDFLLAHWPGEKVSPGATALAPPGAANCPPVSPESDGNPALRDVPAPGLMRPGADPLE